MKDENLDLGKVPFAAWLEEAIPALCQMDVRCIGMVAILKDDSVATNVWEASTNDLAAMGFRLMEDGILNTIRNNGKLLKDAIREAGEDEDAEE